VKSRRARFWDFLDERVGHRALLRAMLDEPVRGGARWAYVFGSCLMFVLVTQAVTGVLLASAYSPSVSAAWASVAYVQREITWGWLVRGLHASGASAMVILCALHLLQVTVWGAYRRPREVNWWIGLLLMLALFAFALTGYLLPWDQRGYWATQVATGLVGATPWLGPWLKALLLGGPEYGNLTLTRFFSLHVIVLPAITATLVIAHVALFRRHGVTPGWRRGDAALDAASQPFWPDQLARDFAAMAVVLAVMLLVVVRGHGAPLEAPADPASAYDARPEWYFLPLYQLLKSFPGRLEWVGALGAPLLAGGLLFLLPLLDRGPTRAPGSRKRFIGAVLLVLLGAAALGMRAELRDRADPGFRRFRARAEREAERALALAAQGVPPAGGVAVYDNDPSQLGRRLYADRCSGCHLYDGQGERKGPDLDGWSSRAWIRDFLRDPEAPRFYGATKVRGMKPVKLAGADLDALVEWIWSQGGEDGSDRALAQRGAELFTESDCDDCHDSGGKGGGNGKPDLGGRASAEWIKAFLSAPQAPRFFDNKNTMTRFAGKLSDGELDALAALLRAERLPPPPGRSDIMPAR